MKKATVIKGEEYVVYNQSTTPYPHPPYITIAIYYTEEE